MKVTLHPGAEQDLVEAASFYEREGSPTLAARFVSEFKRVAQLLSEYPDIGSPRSNGRRGLPISIFPYTLIYHSNDKEVKILVVKHDRKRPLAAIVDVSNREHDVVWDSPHCTPETVARRHILLIYV